MVPRVDHGHILLNPPSHSLSTQQVPDINIPTMHSLTWRLDKKVRRRLTIRRNELVDRCQFHSVHSLPLFSEKLVLQNSVG
jgi:hypothetical protein